MATPTTGLRLVRGLVVALLLAALAACSSSPNRGRSEAGGADSTKASGEIARGKASWYGPGFDGRRTANGERFDMDALTAAHRTLPFGTRVRVRNTLNGREVVVRINDRGPHARGRIIDLSKAAAQALDMVRVGEAPVLLLAP